MTPQEWASLELTDYRRTRACHTEWLIFTLTDVIDQLTDQNKFTEGNQMICANRQMIKDTLIKIHDLFVETEPSDVIHLNDLRQCRANS